MRNWGKFWTNDTKRPKNPAAAFEEPRDKQGTAHSPLHTTSPKGWTNHLSHPFGLTPGHTPTFTPYKEQAHPLTQGASKQRADLLCVLTPPCCSRVPSKGLPEFLVWPLIDFYWLRRPWTLVGNTGTEAFWKASRIMVRSSCSLQDRAME